MGEEAIESVSVVIDQVVLHLQEEEKAAGEDHTPADPTAQIKEEEEVTVEAEREAHPPEENTLTEAHHQDLEEAAKTAEIEREARDLRTAEM